MQTLAPLFAFALGVRMVYHKGMASSQAERQTMKSYTVTHWRREIDPVVLGIYRANRADEAIYMAAADYGLDRMNCTAHEAKDEDYE